MPENRKISLLEEFSSGLASFPSSNIMVPIVKDGANYKLDIAVLISAIKGAIADAAAIGGGDSEEPGLEIDSLTLLTINNRLTSLETRASTIEADMSTPSKWPLHIIKITDGNNVNEHVLSTHMGGIASVIEVQSTLVTMPLYYVELSLLDPQINNGKLSGTVTARIKGLDAVGNNLDGGTINRLDFAVDYYSSGAYSLWNGQYQLATFTATTVTPSNDATCTFYFEENISQSSANNVIVKMRINSRTDVEVTVSAGLGGSNKVAALINPVSS